MPQRVCLTVDTAVYVLVAYVWLSLALAVRLSGGAAKVVERLLPRPASTDSIDSRAETSVETTKNRYCRGW